MGIDNGIMIWGSFKRWLMLAVKSTSESADVPYASAATRWTRVRAEAGGLAHAFISFDPADSHDADSIRMALEAAGMRVWRDWADVRPGEDRRDRTRQAISGNALVFLACFSTASTATARSRQHEELAWAAGEMRQRDPAVPWLIPVRFDDCLIPDLDIGASRSLRDLRTADLFGARRQEELARLVETVIWIRQLSTPWAARSTHR
jgi:TIR domain